MANHKKNNALHSIFICLYILVLTGTLYAHGHQKHVLGTVKSISADSILVETATHETQTVQVTKETKFTKSGSPSSLSAVQAGDRVVIHAKPVGEKLEATEVMIGNAGKVATSHH